MLAVVEHEQGGPVAEHVEQPGELVHGARGQQGALARPEHVLPAADRRVHLGVHGLRGHRRELGDVRGRVPRGDCLGQRGLAGAAGAGQGEQPGAAEPVLDLAEHRVPADQPVRTRARTRAGAGRAAARRGGRGGAFGEGAEPGARGVDGAGESGQVGDVGELGERFGPGQGEGLAGRLRGTEIVELFEAGEIDAGRIHVEQVAGRAGDDGLGADRPAKPGYQRLQRVGARRLAVPQLVGQVLGPAHLAGGERQ